MNKRIFTLLFAFILLFSGCGATAAFSYLDKPSVAVFIDANDTRMNNTPSESSLIQALTQKNLSYTVYRLDEDFESEILKANFDGCNIFVAALSDAKFAKSIFEHAQLNQIPVVFCGVNPGEQLLAGYDKAWYVGSNEQKQGELLGEALVEKYKSGDISDKNSDHLVQCLLITRSDQDSRIDATLRVFENYGIFSQQVDILVIPSEIDDAEVLSVLEAHQDTELLLCADAELAQAALAAGRELNLSIPAACYGKSDVLLDTLFSQGLLACPVFDEASAVNMVAQLTYNISRKVSPTDGTDIRLDETGRVNAGFTLHMSTVIMGEENEEK